MRIVVIGPVKPYRGGISHFTMQLCKAILEKGFTLKTISYKYQYPSVLYPGKSDKTDENFDYPNTDYIISSINPITWYKTYQKIKIFDPNIIILQWWTTFWAIPLGFLIRFLNKGNYDIRLVVHNTIQHEKKIFDKLLTKFGISKINNFYFLTPNEKQKLEILFGNKFIKNKNIEVLFHPIYDLFSKKYKDKSSAREELNINNSEFVILFFGFIRKYKGLQILIESMKILKDKGIFPFLIIAGEFWESKNEFINKINIYGLQSKILILDRYISDEEISLVFSASDLFVAPYIGGSQSGTIKIAMNFNLPIIATEHLVSDLEKNYNKLRLIPRSDYKSLANEIYKVKETHQNPNDNLHQNDLTWDNFVKGLIS